MGRVLISAGHTMMDPGAIFRDLREADLTRAIAPKIIPYIEKAGLEVKGVPLDLPLLQRIQWINNTGYTEEAGDVCVEIHINDGGNRGIEAWYRGEGGNGSHKLAKVTVDTITDITGYKSQGIKSELDHELGSLTFLNRTNTASILLETLYMDNDEDIAILKNEDKLEELAKAVATGILKYMGKDADGKDLPESEKPKLEDVKAQARPKTNIPVKPGAFMGNVPARMPTQLGGTFPQSPAMQAFSGRPANTNFMADREQRKDMIEKTYMKLLGRKPSQSDLNYFLNMGINEIDLIKKMVDSQEHLDLVKAKQELADVKDKSSKQAQHILKLETAVNDQKAMLINLNHLLQHKNQALGELEQSIQTKHGMPSQVVKSMSRALPAPASESDGKERRVKLGLSQRLFHFLSKRFS